VEGYVLSEQTERVVSPAEVSNLLQQGCRAAKAATSIEELRNDRKRSSGRGLLQTRAACEMRDERRLKTSSAVIRGSSSMSCKPEDTSEGRKEANVLLPLPGLLLRLSTRHVGTERRHCGLPSEVGSRVEAHRLDLKQSLLRVPCYMPSLNSHRERAISCELQSRSRSRSSSSSSWAYGGGGGVLCREAISAAGRQERLGRHSHLTASSLHLHIV
jgi:hypothetical protein